MLLCGQLNLYLLNNIITSYRNVRGLNLILMEQQEILVIIENLQGNLHNAEKLLSEEDFREFSDSTYTLITYWQTIADKMG